MAPSLDLSKKIRAPFTHLGAAIKNKNKTLIKPASTEENAPDSAKFAIPAIHSQEATPVKANGPALEPAAPVQALALVPASFEGALKTVVEANSPKDDVPEKKGKRILARTKELFTAGPAKVEKRTKKALKKLLKKALKMSGIEERAINARMAEFCVAMDLVGEVEPLYIKVCSLLGTVAGHTVGYMLDAIEAVRSLFRRQN